MCVAPAGFFWQTQRGTATRVQTALHFQHLELRVFRGDADFGVEQDFHAPGEAVTLHGDDQGLGVARAGEAHRIDLVALHREGGTAAENRRPQIQFDAGGEMLAGSVQYRNSQFRIIVQPFQCLADGVVNRGRQRVVFFGAVDVDDQNVAFLTDFDVFHKFLCKKNGAMAVRKNRSAWCGRCRLLIAATGSSAGSAAVPSGRSSGRPAVCPCKIRHWRNSAAVFHGRP